jgi:hypothetical protein
MNDFSKRVFFFLVFFLMIVGAAEEKNSSLSLSGLVLQQVQAGENPSTTFAWHANRPGITRAQIALGRAVTLKFDFTLQGDAPVSRVKFGIPKKFVNMGIKIDPGQVEVQNGMASSKSIFTVPPGMPLGRFDMPIVAVDAEAGKEIGRGMIPFMLLPAGVGGC